MKRSEGILPVPLHPSSVALLDFLDTKDNKRSQKLFHFTQKSTQIMHTKNSSSAYLFVRAAEVQ